MSNLLQLFIAKYLEFGIFLLFFVGTLYQKSKMQAMLSSKKTKQHGMKSQKWNVNDKITQYKGLVNLYARDKKIFDNDTNVSQKKLKKEIRKQRNEVDNQRAELDNAILGDRQRMRNTLTDHRDLQLAYQNMHPSKVLEVLDQTIFSRKKELDLVKFRTKQKTEQLVKLKLEYSEYEDRIKYESKDQIPEEDKAQTLTAIVRDAILKIEAAIEIKNTYNQILSFLKKDAIYFDAVLVALQVDGYGQGRCILKVTEMGQLATEYLDDKTEEYQLLEKTLKKSMKERDKSLKGIQDQLNSLSKNVKYLIRKDSKIALDEEYHSKHSYSEILLIRDIETIEKTLNHLKEITVVGKIKDVIPRLDSQIQQKMRLDELVKKSADEKDILLTKSRHAEEMYNNLAHSMVNTTLWYNDRKSSLNTEISELQKTNSETWELIEDRGYLFTSVRTRLEQLAEILRNVSSGPTQAAKKKAQVIVETSKKPEIVEADTMQLITFVTQKLTTLSKAAEGVTTDAERAQKYFQKFVSDMTVTTNIFAAPPKEESLIADLYLEDPMVASRAEMKARSAEICEKNAKTEFDII